VNARRRRGFTLLEVLLALVVLVASLGVLIASLSSGLKQVSSAERETEASLHAQSLLDGLDALEPLRPGHDAGETADGRYRWTIDVEPVDDPAPVNPGIEAPVARPLEGGPRLLKVTLVLAWGEGGPRQQLQVVTLRARTPTDLGPGAQ
jgi:general secretion pathway protein I